MSRRATNFVADADAGASSGSALVAAACVPPPSADIATTAGLGSRASSFKLPASNSKSDVSMDLPQGRFSPAPAATPAAPCQTSMAAAHPAAATVLQTPFISPTLSFGLGRHFTRSNSSLERSAASSYREGASKVPLLAGSSATAVALTAAAVSNTEEFGTPSATATVAAAAAAGAAAMVPETSAAPVTNTALFPVRITASPLSVSPVSPLSYPYTSSAAPGYTPLGSPSGSPVASFRVCTQGNGGDGGGGGSLLRRRISSNTICFLPGVPAGGGGGGGAAAAAPAAIPGLRTTLSERRIQRLLHRIDSMCSAGSSAGHSFVSPGGGGTYVLCDNDVDRDGNGRRPYNGKSPSSPSPMPHRLDEQGVQELLMMLPRSPEAARMELAYAAAAADGGSSHDGGSDVAASSGGSIFAPLPLQPLPGARGTGADAATVGGITVAAAEAAVVREEGEAHVDCCRPLSRGHMETAAATATVAAVIVGVAAAAAAEVEEPLREQLLELTLRPFVGNPDALISERYRDATDVIDGRIAPCAVSGVAVGEVGAIAAVHAWAAEDSGGGVAGCSTGGNSGGAGAGDKLPSNGGPDSGSLCDSADLDLSAWQAVNHGSVDRDRGSTRPGTSASTPVPSTAASFALPGVAAAALASSVPASVLPPPASTPPPPVMAKTPPTANSPQGLHYKRDGRRRKAWSSDDEGSSSGGSRGCGGCGGRSGGEGFAAAQAATARQHGSDGSDGGSDGEGLAAFVDLAGAHAKRVVVGGAAAGRRYWRHAAAGQTDGVDLETLGIQQHQHQQLQQHLQQQQQQLQQQLQEQGECKFLAPGAQRWSVLQPRPPSGSRPRAVSTQASPLHAWGPPAAAAVAAEGFDASGSCLATKPRRGAVPMSSPLRARLTLSPSGRSKRSLSESSALLRDPSGLSSQDKSAKAAPSPPSPPSPLYGSRVGGGVGKDDESSESECEIRFAGLTAAAGPRLLTISATPSPPPPPQPPPAAAAAGGSSAAAALQAAANLVAAIDEDLSRCTIPATVSSGTQAHHASFASLPAGANEQETWPPPPASQPPLYPHPPPALPPHWTHHQQSPPAAAAAAAPIPAEATVALQWELSGRSRRRLAALQRTLKHAAIVSRLETLDEDGAHSRTGQAATAFGDSSSNSSSGGWAASPRRTTPGTSHADSGCRRQSVPNRSRRSTSSTARHLSRRHRLTGEPGGSSSSDSSSGGEAYLQSLFRPLRNPPAGGDVGGAFGGLASYTPPPPPPPLMASSLPLAHPIGSDVPCDTSGGDVRPSFGFLQPSPSYNSQVTEPSPPPPPPLPLQQHADQAWARRPSARLLGAGTGSGASFGASAPSATFAVRHPLRGRGTPAAAAAAPPPYPLPTARTYPGVAPWVGGSPSARPVTTTMYDDVGGAAAAAANGVLAVNDSGSSFRNTEDSSATLNVDRIKRDLERLLAK